MRVVTRDEAFKILKTWLPYGKYSVTLNCNGSIFSPKTNKWETKPLYTSEETIFCVVEDYYIVHGGGD